MLITMSVGVGLKAINEGTKSIDSEQFLFQNVMIVHDALHMLKTSSELEQISSAIDLSNFLLSSEAIPFQSNGFEVLIRFSSARSKINPNVLKTEPILEAFQDFITLKGVNGVYGNFLLDTVSGIKEDQTYTTELFNQAPTLFRDYIVSEKHLERINDFYLKAYHDANLKDLNTSELFYFSKDSNSSIDLNYASASTYQIVLACDPLRAEALSLDENVFEKVEDLRLSEVEIKNLAKFKTSFFEPYLDVNIEITNKDKRSKIRFEYNIKSKKGSNFVFEV